MCTLYNEAVSIELSRGWIHHWSSKSHTISLCALVNSANNHPSFSFSRTLHLLFLTRTYAFLYSRLFLSSYQSLILSPLYHSIFTPYPRKNANIEWQSPIDEGKIRASCSQLLQLCEKKVVPGTGKFPDWHLCDFLLFL